MANQTSLGTCKSPYSEKLFQTNGTIPDI